MSTKNKQQLQSELDKLYAEKQKLVEAKAAFPDKWTDKTQAKLDKIVEDVVDLEEQLELAQDEVPTTESETPTNQQPTSDEEEKYTPAEGTEKMVHLQIVHGRRFNPSTGKEESAPYTQLFTFGEFELFKENHKKLGYSVLKVLYDPFGAAAELITK